jgi:hypothetical protein
MTDHRYLEDWEYAELGRKYGVCFWCDSMIIDGSPESGGDQDIPDWMDGVMVIDGTPGLHGDYGCGEHPISDEDGTGPHETRGDVIAIVRKYHGAES